MCVCVIVFLSALFCLSLISTMLRCETVKQLLFVWLCRLNVKIILQLIVVKFRWWFFGTRNSYFDLTVGLDVAACDARAREILVQLMRSTTLRCRRRAARSTTSSSTQSTRRSSVWSISNSMASASPRSSVLTRWNGGRASVSNLSTRMLSSQHLLV